MARQLRGVVAPLALALLLALLWWLVSATGRVPAFVLPTPGSVAAALGRLLGSPVFWPYAGQTAVEALGGSVLGAVVAIPLGVLLHRSPTASAAANPFLGATQAVPAIAIAPLLVLWVGYGTGAIVVLCALMVFFPILIATVVGLRHVDPAVIAAAKLDGATGWQRLLHVELPLALPQLLAGVRNGVALSATGAVVGEMVMGGRGLGTLLTIQRDSVDTAAMVATIVVLCALAASAYTLVRVVEHRALAASGIPTTDRRTR